MKYNIIFVFLLLTLLFYPTINVLASKNVTLYYYWGDGCPHCAKVAQLINSLNKKYPNLKVIKKEIWNNQNNAKEFAHTLENLNVPNNQRGVPFVKIENDYLIGDQPIINNLDSLIEKYLYKTPQQKNNADVVNVSNRKFSFLAITGAALADSINPCAIAVLIILLSFLMLLNEKKRALKSGISFIAGVYITYFILGMGLLYVLKLIPSISKFIYIIVGIIAIIIGLSNIKDYFWYGGGGFVTEIPRRWRPLMQKILKGATSPIVAFLTGMIITSFELPCTGGPYFFTIGLLTKNISWSKIILILSYYNFIFILPLIIILFLIYIGYSNIKNISGWRQKNIKVMHLIAGVIMLALGIWIILI